MESSTKSNAPSLQGISLAPKQSKPNCHYERSEESQNFIIETPCQRQGKAIQLIVSILIFAFPLNLKAVELSALCTAGKTCTIDKPQSEITNTAPFSVYQIQVKAQINTFINYSNLNSTDNQAFMLENDTLLGKIKHFINHGNISGGIRIVNASKMLELETLTNYGTMRGVWTLYQPIMITVNNFGTITTNQGTYYQGYQGDKAAHFAFESKEAKLAIQNYTITISEAQGEFNEFEGYYDKTNNKNSHLIIMYNAYTPTAQNVYFKDADSKIILDFDNGFEFGKKYAISKLVTDRLGKSVSVLPVDFSRLTTRNDIYTLSQQGDSFVVQLAPQHSTIGNLYKSNIRTMTNFYTMSNSMIYPHKYNAKRNTNKKRVIRRVKKVSSLRDSTQSVESWQSTDSLESLQSNKSFAYKNDSNNSIDSTTRRRIKTTNQSNNHTSQSMPSTLSNQNNYYFILTPFINHNLFFESGRYNLSGFDYGFLTAFSGKLTESNTLGAHFAFSYGNLGDKQDKDLSIKSLNLNVGLNYKLDLVWDMYLKARGDFYYFSNALDSATLKNIKPSNLGFGASVSYGKEWDFKSGGVLGIEAGLDYKALQSSKVELNNNATNSISETYQKSLYHLLYADVGLNYAKYFGGFGINLGGGFRANLAPKLAESALLINTQTLKFTLDNDKYLGYANAGISYLLNAKSFDMEFSLAYYGNFGDRAISNAGGFEWRVFW